VDRHKNPGAVATDWDQYYKSVPATARLTRTYTTATLLKLMRSYTRLGSGAPATILEFGGANSCFLDKIVQEFSPAAYHVIDTNAYGLGLLRKRLSPGSRVHLHQASILDMARVSLKADVVFSVGLIEHFEKQGTAKAVEAHLDCLNPGGCAIITFPTPTWLYRAARGVAEAAGAWKFHDERPLQPDEILRVLGNREILHQKTLWPLVFTQHLLVCR